MSICELNSPRNRWIKRLPLQRLLQYMCGENTIAVATLDVTLLCRSWIVKIIERHNHSLVASVETKV